MQGGSAPPQPGVDIPTGAFVAKITNDAREEEMEENMQQVSQILNYILLKIFWLGPSAESRVPNCKKHEGRFSGTI